MFSDEALVMVRPFRRYRELAAAHPEPNVPLARPLLMLLLIAGFVSLTSAGRLVAQHILLAMIAWSFLPVLQIIFMTVVVRAFHRTYPIGRAIDLFYAGQGPWMVFLLLLASLCVFAPEPWPIFERLLDTGALFGALLVAAFWSVVLTFAFFRSALSLRRPFAFAATALYYLGFGGTIVAYYTVTGQLLPLLMEVK